MKKPIMLTLAAALLLAVNGFAQKFGYCNSSALLTEIPEVKQADSELKSYQNMLQKKGQDMVKALQEKADVLKRKQDQGTISPKDFETQSADLKKEEEGIADYEQEMYDKVAEKRKLLFDPILEKVNKAMADVAAENGYMFVFDLTSNVLLYADESLDVSALVKKKLNL